MQVPLTVSVVFYNHSTKDIRTALLHLVLALAHVTHAIALLEGILAYGFCGWYSPVVLCDEPRTVLEGSKTIVPGWLVCSSKR